MSRKRILIPAIVVVILAALLWLQFNTWRRFDWSAFADATSRVTEWRGIWHLLVAVALIYFTYWLRAVRWKVFLRPVCHARLSRLTPAQYIGFTGLALLGRPGELIRPYLIARKENLSFSSQIAVWTVERIFDIGAFAILVCLDVFTAGYFGQRLPHLGALYRGGFILVALVVVMGLGAWAVRRHGQTVARWLERLKPLSPRMNESICRKIRAFGEGLNTIHDGISFVQLAGVSLAIWFTIALAYRFVLHAYPQPALRHMHVPQVLLLMASSIIGSLIQLPAIGGGSQLAVISMLSSVEWFAVPHELAVSAGMLLWLVTFMAVIPAGLILAHREHVSLRRLSEASETIADQAVEAPG